MIHIMGTILGWKQDSPLFKSLKKARRITNVGGFTSLTNQAINRLKYQDDSSRTPVKEELGHGYQQLIRCFNAFVLLKNDEGKPIHGKIGRTSPWQPNFKNLNHRYRFVHDDTGPGMLPRCR
jgi:hypothetical protein